MENKPKKQNNSNIKPEANPHKNLHIAPKRFGLQKYNRWAAILIVGLVAIAGIAIVYYSRASEKTITKDNVVATFSNYTTAYSYSSGAKKSNVVINFFKNGTQRQTKQDMVLLEVSKENETKYSYQHFTVNSGQYVLCQFGIIENNALKNISLNTSLSGGGVEIGQVISTQPSLDKEIKDLQNSVPQGTKNASPKNIYCTDVFKVNNNNTQLTYKTAITGKSNSNTKVYLSNYFIVTPTPKWDNSEDDLRHAQKATDDCIDNKEPNGKPKPGTKMVGGTITDSNGQPVPALIGLDYSLKDGLSEKDYPFPEDRKVSFYEDVVTINVAQTQPKDLTKWCARIPEGVDTVYIEVYSREIKSTQDNNIIMNNAWNFGGVQKHNIKLNPVSAGSAGSTIVKNDVNIVLPSACTYGGGASNVKAGNINTRVYINGKEVGKEDVVQYGDKQVKVGTNSVTGAPIYELQLDTKVIKDVAQPSRNIAWTGRTDGDQLAGYAAAEYKDARYGIAAMLYNLAPQTPGYRVKTETIQGDWRYHTWVPDVPVYSCQTTQVQIFILDDSSITQKTYYDNIFVLDKPSGSACYVYITDPNKNVTYPKNCWDKVAWDGKTIEKTDGVLKVKKDNGLYKLKKDRTGSDWINARFDYF